MTTPIHSQMFEVGAQTPWTPDPRQGGIPGTTAPTSGREPLPADPLGYLPYGALLERLMGRQSTLHALCGHRQSLDWDQLLDCGPQPADPASLKRWQAVREAHERLKPLLKDREERLTEYARRRDYQAALAELKAHDPLFERTMHMMEHCVERLPQVIRQLALPVLASEFGLFSEFYRHVREGAWLVESHRRGRGTGPPIRTSPVRTAAARLPGAGNWTPWCAV